MSFIGESRKDYNHPWYDYVCLEKEDCELLLKAIRSVIEKTRKTYFHYKDIQDAGEASSRQQTALMKAEEKYDRALDLLTNVEKFLK